MTSKKLIAADRMMGFEENIWVEFSQLAAEHNITTNLGQGFPDFAPPKHLTRALSEATQSDNPLLNQYARVFGHPRLVNVLAKLYSKLTGLDINPMTDILVTVGAYQSLYCAIQSNVNPGDEVIIIEPFFDCYLPMVLMAGGVPVFVPLRPSRPGERMSSDDWKLDEGELASKFNLKTKAIIVNTPHNPLGKVFKRHELQLIADLAKKWDVLVIMDEVYEFIVFEGNEHVRMVSLPGMWERTITIGSGGKAFSATGWKMGWTYGPKNLIEHSRVLHQNCVYSCNMPVQEALAATFELELGRLGTAECYFEQLKSMLKDKRDKMVSYSERSGLIPVVPEAGYLMIADYCELGRKFEFDDGSSKPNDHKFCRWMCIEKKLAAIPNTGFYSEPHKRLADNYLRFCYIKDDKTLNAAGQILLEMRNA